MSKHIRFIKSVVLTTEYEGEKVDVAFCFGSVYPVNSVKQHTDGSCDIEVADGTKINGVSASIFRCHGFQPEQIKQQAKVEVAQEIIELQFDPLPEEDKIDLIGDIVIDTKPIKKPQKGKK